MSKYEFKFFVVVINVCTVLVNESWFKGETNNTSTVKSYNIISVFTMSTFIFIFKPCYMQSNTVPQPTAFSNHVKIILLT